MSRTDTSKDYPPHPDQDPCPSQVCSPLTLVYADQAARLYSEVFLSDEPTTCRHAPSFKQFLPYAEMYTRFLIKKGLSFIVTDRKTGMLIGFIFCVDLTDGPEQEGGIMIEFLSHFKEAIEMIHELEERYFDQESILPGSIIHVYQIGVRRQFRRMGIAQGMILQVISHAREKGYSQIVADCTSQTSKLVFERCGFHEVDYYSYRDFCTNGIRFFEGLDRGIALMVKDLEYP